MAEEKITRKLTTILAADVAGYTRLNRGEPHRARSRLRIRWGQRGVPLSKYRAGNLGPRLPLALPRLPPAPPLDGPHVPPPDRVPGQVGEDR